MSIQPAAATAVASNAAPARTAVPPKATPAAPTDQVQISAAARAAAGGDRDGDGDSR
jgi:hypothetical protein